MSDDLDDLKSLMKDVTPRPDPARRAANLRMAQENFDEFDGPNMSSPYTPIEFKFNVTNPFETRGAVALRGHGLGSGWSIKLSHSFPVLDPKETILVTGILEADDQIQPGAHSDAHR